MLAAFGDHYCGSDHSCRHKEYCERGKVTDVADKEFCCGCDQATTSAAFRNELKRVPDEVWAKFADDFGRIPDGVQWPATNRGSDLASFFCKRGHVLSFA